MSLLRLHGHKGGRFRITPKRHFVIKLEKASSGWRAVYLGQLAAMPEIAGDSADDAVSTFVPGDRYPLARAKGRTFSVLQRDRRLIADKTPEGIRFAVPPDAINDPGKASALHGTARTCVHLGHEDVHRVRAPRPVVSAARCPVLTGPRLS